MYGMIGLSGLGAFLMLLLTISQGVAIATKRSKRYWLLALALYCIRFSVDLLRAISDYHRA
jgi:hypothetical protein